MNLRCCLKLFFPFTDWDNFLNILLKVILNRSGKKVKVLYGNGSLFFKSFINGLFISCLAYEQAPKGGIGRREKSSVVWSEKEREGRSLPFFFLTPGCTRLAPLADFSLPICPTLGAYSQTTSSPHFFFSFCSVDLVN